MKKVPLLPVVLATWLVCTVAAPAQTPTPVPAAAPDATTAPDHYQPNPPTAVRLAAIEHDAAALKGQPCDMIFIGDSITAGWMGGGKDVWAKYYAPRHAFNFGVSGDTTRNVLWRFKHIDLTGLHPKVAVILIGTNNTKNTSQEIADGVKAVITQTQAAFPGVKIILVSIMPNIRAQDKMMAADEIIRKFADDQSVYYLDLVPLMPPVVTKTADGKTDTNWKGLGKDHLHPGAEGYQIWADAMEPLVKKLLPDSSG